MANGPGGSGWSWIVWRWILPAGLAGAAMLYAFFMERRMADLFTEIRAVRGQVETVQKEMRLMAEQRTWVFDRQAGTNPPSPEPSEPIARAPSHAAGHEVVWVGEPDRIEAEPVVAAERKRKLIPIPAASRLAPDTASAIRPDTIVTAAVVDEGNGPTRLFGVMMGRRVQEAVAEIGGRRHRFRLDREYKGWRLAELQRRSAVFESPSGQRRTLSLFSETSRP